MNLHEIVGRTPVPHPWTEGEKIPWDDTAFSRRMLAEHLSDAHDHASRRAVTIDEHVAWIDRIVRNGRSLRILDLGCGPGLYTTRLAQLGHSCVGIDFSPASIEHANSTSASLGCAYLQGDIRQVEYGDGFDLVMLIFGEFNVFSSRDAGAILSKARAALRDNGRLLLEVHSVNAIRAIGSTSPSWRSAERGLFSDRPHLRLEEAFWDDDARIATERYYIIDAETADVTRYAQSMQAYTDDEYRTLLRETGFGLSETFPSLSGAGDGDDDLFVLLAVAD